MRYEHRTEIVPNAEDLREVLHSMGLTNCIKLGVFSLATPFHSVTGPVCRGASEACHWVCVCSRSNGETHSLSLASTFALL